MRSQARRVYYLLWSSTTISFLISRDIFRLFLNFRWLFFQRIQSEFLPSLLVCLLVCLIVCFSFFLQSSIIFNNKYFCFDKLPTISGAVKRTNRCCWYVGKVLLPEEPSQPSLLRNRWFQVGFRPANSADRGSRGRSRTVHETLVLALQVHARTCI